MKMIWRSEHGKTFDVLFSESDPFLELKRIIKNHSDFLFYLSGEDPRFYKRGIGQYPARLSGGFQSPTEINASAPQCSTGALLRMLRHGGSQPRKKEGASHHARRGKNAEAFLNHHRAMLNASGTPKRSRVNHEHRGVHFRVDDYDLTYFVFNYRISNIKT